MEKERAVDAEKINNLEMKLVSLEDKRKLEVSTLEREYEKIKELYKTDKTELSNEINKLRDEIDEVNRKKVEI